jgi:hypothetical protein
MCGCECDTEKIVSGSHLRAGGTVSCGCARRERMAAGARRTPASGNRSSGKQFPCMCGRRSSGRPPDTVLDMARRDPKDLLAAMTVCRGRCSPRGLGLSSTAPPKVFVVAEAKSELARIAAQLEDLKRLAILQLLVSGAQSGHIASALNIDPSTISRMMPVRDIKRLASKQPQDTG